MAGSVSRVSTRRADHLAGLGTGAAALDRKERTVDEKTTVDPVVTGASSFVICTRDRPDELRRCLATLAHQSIPPAEVVVVDASEADSEATVRAIGEEADLRVVYVRHPPGRTRQLNHGIGVSTGDPVFLIDDDVELDPAFHQQMLTAFERGRDVGGVQGTIIDDTYGSPLKRAFRTVFLHSRHTQDRPGRLLPSGYYTTPVRPSDLREAQALRLCGLGFRRQVFDDFSFDESLEGYALKEDVDFSYRVSQRYRLLIAPEAKFRHLKTPAARIGVREKSRMHIVNNYLIFRKNLKGSFLQYLAFSWAMLGRLIYEAVRSAVNRDPNYLYGALAGIREIAARRRSES